MINEPIQYNYLDAMVNTTENCNLACKYCYEISKRHTDMNIDVYKKFIDLIIMDDNIFGLDEELKKKNRFIENGIILDFIGGDSLTNVDLLDDMVKYFLYKTYTTNSKNAKNWRTNWRILISTNGTFFKDEKVRRFCEKYKDSLSLSVSIDGCPEIHDKNRIFKERDENGNEVGSMSAILDGWDWYLNLMGIKAQTKSTLAKDSIPYIAESLKFMHEDLNLHFIYQNFIMENAHTTAEDYKELTRQLTMCVDYVYEHKDDVFWSLFSEGMVANHKSYDEDDLDKPICGSGSMLCLDVRGDIYPCHRWAPISMKNHEGKMKLGNVSEGLTQKSNSTLIIKSSMKCNLKQDEKCKQCKYESACKYCIAGCYNEFGDFKRSTYICELAKIQCEYAKRYWNKFYGYEKYKIDPHFDYENYYYDPDHKFPE